MSAPATLYIIATEQNGRLVGPVKVGMTKAVGSRLACLQTGNPRRLGVYLAAELKCRGVVAGLEEVFHTVMAGKRLVGEWFDMTPQEAKRALLRDCRDYLESLSEAEALSLERRHGVSR